MRQHTLIGKTTLANNTPCKVMYHKSSDMVEVEVGGTTLKFEAANFIVVHEMLRKAAARIVMQTETKFAL